MGHLITDHGWEYLLKVAVSGTVTPPDTLIVALYDDSSDSIGAGDDFADISGSEPTGASYARQTPQRSSVSVTFVDGRWQCVLPDTVFDVTDSNTGVTSAAIGAEFVAEGDDAAQSHILVTGGLGETVDLSSRSEPMTVKHIGMFDNDNISA